MGEYTTNITNLAGFLIVRGHKLRDIRVVERQRNMECVFIFGPEAEIDAEGYAAGETVPAVTYAEALRSLKQKVHNTLNK